MSRIPKNKYGKLLNEHEFTVLRCHIVPNIDTINTVEPYTNILFDKIKYDLNETKSKLDSIKKNSTWTEFNKIIDLYKMLKIRLADYNVQHYTNAWAKYYELISHYKLITDNITAFFNAELPGTGICATNHFVKTHNIEMNWRASSLIDKNALGDRYKLVANNPEKWLMDDNNNGDTTLLSNLLDFERKIGDNKVDFYAHDAGIDVTNEYNEQEEANSKIHFGCAIAGFLTLKIGGNFIAKQYSYFHTFTWNAILIYAGLFNEFYICKPYTSRPYNSEIYLVGKGFKGLTGELRELFLNRIENWSMQPLISYERAKEQYGACLEKLEKFAKVIFDAQILYLNENIDLYNRYKNNLQSLSDQMEIYSEEQCDMWIKKFHIEKLDTDDFI